MSDSTPDMKLIPLGRCRGYDLVFNPVNQRVICERKVDLATVLFDCPSGALVRNWGASEDDVKALRDWLDAAAHDRTLVRGRALR